MATTKKSAAKKTVAKTSPAKKTVAKKASARKPAAKKSAARTTSAKRTAAKPNITETVTGTVVGTADAVRGAVTVTARETNDTIQQYVSIAGAQASDALDFLRSVADVTVGVPFAVQARLADSTPVTSVDLDTFKTLVSDAKARLSSAPSVDFDAVKAFLDTAKAEGHARIELAQHYVAPFATTAGERLGAATGLVEQIPAQLGDLVETGRARIKSLIPA